MPWHVVAHHASCPTSTPFGVVKDATGEVVGCHASEADASAQVRALYASEPDMMGKSAIAKIDPERRLVFGWASVAVTKDGTQVVDHEDDMIDPRDLEDAAYEFVLNFGDATVGHDGPDNPTVGKLVESFVSTPDKLTALGLAPDALPVGWWAGWRIEDDAAWEGVKSGRFQAFSIEGVAERVPA